MCCSPADLRCCCYHLELTLCKYVFSKWEFSYDPLETTACFSQYSVFFMRVGTVVILPYFWFFFFRLSTKPGCVPSTLKSHSLTAERPFLASNTVWRFRRGVRLYCLTTMKSSTEDSPVSSVQVQCTPGSCHPDSHGGFSMWCLLVLLLSITDMPGSFPCFSS